MWSKLANVLKPHLGSSSTKEEPSPAASSRSEAGKAYTHQHRASIFSSSTNEQGVLQPTSGEGNFESTHGKRNIFKRLSRSTLKEDIERARSPSPFQHSQTLPKKLRNLPSLFEKNGSQVSLAAHNADPTPRASFDVNPPSPIQEQDSPASVKTARKQSSLDLLRNEKPHTPHESRHMSHSSDSDFLTPAQDHIVAGSVRSILRDRNTPGTGQSVRFTGDAFKVMTPDHSQSIDLSENQEAPVPQSEMPFLERLAQAGPSSSTPLVMPRMNSNSKPRPRLAGIFDDVSGENKEGDVSDTSFCIPSDVPGTTPKIDHNPFDISHQIEMPAYPPPGLEFNSNPPVVENSFNSSQDMSFVVKDPVLDGSSNRRASPTASDSKGKAKEEPVNFNSPNKHTPAAAPAVVDQSIFHKRERSHKTTPAHERSQSFSFGQTVFFSMQHQNGEGKSRQMEVASPSSDSGPSLDILGLPLASSSPVDSSKVRTRAISDTVFQDMLRNSSTSRRGRPEADINDESTDKVVVYAPPQAEPDPFSPHANTYYTPQVMIPLTPPKGMARHVRKTSKEESVIMSLQTEVALKAELCAQYETDLKARDELVEILGKKLSDIEKDEGKRKNALKSWKKKVQDLERTCRQLEEAMDRSRMESMERSVMDEASGEALRMLHRQIAALEREKGDWVKRESGMRGEIETLESLVKERTDDIVKLKETLWTRDEHDMKLKEGIKEAKDQINMIANMSMGIDEEEFQRLMVENQRSTEETEQLKLREGELLQELEELKTKYEGAEIETRRLEVEVEGLNGQLTAKDDEYTTLKAELEAQWQNTESASEQITSLKEENDNLVVERDALKVDLETLDTQITNLENQWTEDENKREELEAELQETLRAREALEQELGQLEESLQHERETVDELRSALQQHAGRIAELEEEKEHAYEEIQHVQDSLHRREEEQGRLIQRVRETEKEIDALHEEIENLEQDHTRALDRQARALEEAVSNNEQLKNQLEETIGTKTEASTELEDRMASLQQEVEKLRRQLHTLQQDSADKDMKVVQMTKQLSQDKEDLLGLNMALESKQQELELIKRKLNVRGTGGSTPAPTSKAAPISRRDSSIFSATPVSRPPSSMSTVSESDNASTVKKRKPSTETLKNTALARSNRVNVGTSSSTSSAGKVSTMGPPTVKRPGSAMATPTPTARGSLMRSSSARPVVKSPPVTAHRRATSSSPVTEKQPLKPKLSRSTVNGSATPDSVSENDEKENVDLTARQRVAVPS